MQYKEVIFNISPVNPWRDILLAYLGELPYDSFVEEVNGLKAYILTEDFDQAALDELCDSLDAQVSFEVKELKQQNWNAVLIYPSNIPIKTILLEVFHPQK